ncbi:conserved hypothetical protein [Paenibacillus curdlanolyticus YK9]|uniref:DoxX family protein n=1 Tax=Paenibacillus curdlanolyticus YK9 TaxID=717606 RepID=E0I655_9BACL|nr:DoxX-like family protein [Paenibacillus curdlanolyticus]EFM12447.1 conserved hypothetical protein [Paenibacillus curdlanolyticus YK9]
MRTKRAKPIYIETFIKTNMDELWKHTQQPELHEQWDLRFSEIRYLPRKAPDSPQSFHYRTRLGFGLAIEGTGETVAHTNNHTGERVSTLRFGSEQPLSLIREGSGYWKYTLTQNGIVFATQYDYKTRFGAAGRWFDRLVFRPLIGYATAWSFDLLRIWLEHSSKPIDSLQRAAIHYGSLLMLVVLWLYEGLVPKWLFPEGGELALLQATNLFQGAEILMLRMIGLCEMIIGIWIVTGHRRASCYWIQIGLLSSLAAAALVTKPDLLQAPFNPLVLTLAMIGLCLSCGLTIDRLPRARNCIRERKTRGKGKRR